MRVRLGESIMLLFKAIGLNRFEKGHHGIVLCISLFYFGAGETGRSLKTFTIVPQNKAKSHSWYKGLYKKEISQMEIGELNSLWL